MVRDVRLGSRSMLVVNRQCLLVIASDAQEFDALPSGLFFAACLSQRPKSFFCAVTVLGHCKGILLLYKYIINLFPPDPEPYQDPKPLTFELLAFALPCTFPISPSSTSTHFGSPSLRDLWYSGSSLAI